MTTLYLYVGLPGSGKTTCAEQVLRIREVGTVARVNRDDLRQALHRSATHEGVTEKQVTLVQRAAITELLTAGVDVIVDDTNLQDRTLRSLVKIGQQAGAEIQIEDFTHVPLATCLERNVRRGDKPPVPDEVIRRMHQRYIKGRGVRFVEDYLETVPEVLPVEHVPGLPGAILVDIDGTVALMNGRSPFDWSRVIEDDPNWPVIQTVRAMREYGYKVIFMSGRDEVCRPQTEEWLKWVNVPIEALHMRRHRDNRKDSVVKLELFDQHVRDRYNVVAVFDDRQQVVDMWRSLGLTVMQVAEGKF